MYSTLHLEHSVESAVNAGRLSSVSQVIEVTSPSLDSGATRSLFRSVLAAVRLVIVGGWWEEGGRREEGGGQVDVEAKVRPCTTLVVGIICKSSQDCKATVMYVHDVSLCRKKWGLALKYLYSKTNHLLSTVHILHMMPVPRIYMILRQYMCMWTELRQLCIACKWSMQYIWHTCTFDTHVHCMCKHTLLVRAENLSTWTVSSNTEALLETLTNIVILPCLRDFPFPVPTK